MPTVDLQQLENWFLASVAPKGRCPDRIVNPPANTKYIAREIQIQSKIQKQIHKGLGLPQVLKKVLKKGLKKITALKKVLKVINKEIV